MSHLCDHWTDPDKCLCLLFQQEFPFDFNFGSCLSLSFSWHFYFFYQNSRIVFSLLYNSVSSSTYFLYFCGIMYINYMRSTLIIILFSLYLSEIDHRPDDGGSTHLWNACPLQRDYTALHLRRPSFILTALRTWNVTSYVVYTKDTYLVLCCDKTCV
jgi:hypothetical protein